MLRKSESIFLVGLMGAGKTTIGKRLAELTDKQFLDSDNEIEFRTGVNIDLIFEIEDEDGFRKRECKIIKELTALDSIILATGGGAILNADNRRHLHQGGTVIYLQASPEQLMQRTAKDQKRPLLKTEDRLGKIEELLKIRGPLYEEVADFIINTDDYSVKKIVNKICQKLKIPCRK